MIKCQNPDCRKPLKYCYYKFFNEVLCYECIKCYIEHPENFRIKLREIKQINGFQETPRNRNSRTFGKTLDSLDNEKNKDSEAQIPEQKGKIKALEKLDFYDYSGNRIYLEEGKEYLSEDFDPQVFQILVESGKVEVLK